MPGRVRNQVREALERHDVAVVDQLLDRLGERHELGHQNGNGCGPLCTVIQRSSVNSSTTAEPPKRPKPLSLTPPKGICGSSPTGWSLTWTIPASTRRASASPRSASWVMIPAANPYAVAFARATASSALSTISIDGNRPERLQPRTLGLVGHVGQERRLEARPLRLAAGEHSRALAHGIRDATLDGLERALVDQRADDRVRLLRVARLQPLRLRHELLDERVRNRALDDDLPGGHADLALVEERPERRRVHRVLEVGVGEHDQRVVAAELEQDPLEVAAGRLGELAPGRGRAGEVEPAHERVLDQLVADRPGLAGRVRDDVEHPRGQPRLGEDLAPEQSTDDRRVLGRLQHDRVAERERRRDRARGEDERGIPGRDRADDPDRAAQAHRERARVGGEHLAERRIGERCRLPEEPRHEHVRLEHPEAERAARLAREERDDLVLSRLEDVGGPEEDALAHGRGRGRPLGEGGVRSLDGTGGVLAAAGCDVGDDLAGEGVERLERAAVGGVDPLAADELAALCRPLLLQLHRVLLRLRIGPTLSTCSRGQDVVPTCGTW